MSEKDSEKLPDETPPPEEDRLADQTHDADQAEDGRADGDPAEPVKPKAEPVPKPDATVAQDGTENGTSVAPQELGADPVPKPSVPLWEEPVFRAGIAVGLFLTLVGLAGLGLQFVGFRIGLLVLCAGLGIVLGAFGATATVQFKGIVIAGVAATTVILVWMIDIMNDDDFIRLRISGLQPGSSTSLSGEYKYPYYEADGYYEFYIFGPNISQDHIILRITEPDQREIAFNCIPSDAVNKYFGSGRSIGWEFRPGEDVNLLTQVDGRTVKDGFCDLPAGFADNHSKGRTSFGAAYAQEVSAVNDLIADLESESSEVRRSARTALGQLGLIAVEPMMKTWRENTDRYRVELGVSVALTESLRSDQSQRADLITLLTDEDLRLLVAAAGDNDRTLRLYASEFLYMLADPRIISLTDDEFEGMSANGKFNSVVLFEGTAPYLTDNERQDALSVLESWRPQVGPETEKKINSLVPTLE